MPAAERFRCALVGPLELNERSRGHNFGRLGTQPNLCQLFSFRKEGRGNPRGG
jgi:hypothetical protein